MLLKKKNIRGYSLHKSSTQAKQQGFLYRFFKTTIRISFLAIILTVTFSLALRAVSGLWSRSKIFGIDDAPEKHAAIVFGARVYSNGRPSAMLADRIATGVDLFHAGKVDYLIMTGDGRTLEYNEPEAMRLFALSLGVPEEAILIDRFGLRTYDSCYRASRVYAIKDAIVVSQDFHVDRVLLTCRGLGLDAVAVSADYQRPNGYSRHSLTYSRLREIPATLGAVLDIIGKAKPETIEPKHPLSMK